MTLKIISAEDVLYKGEVDAVHLPGKMGAFTVLPGHAALISTLTPGAVRFTVPAENAERSVDIQGGIVDVDSNVVSVCIY
ncbi:MAG: ATP synthase F1 subunit epsilon [Duncaniella sp.]|nr:ATP synthase F1 subunit epsilon [Duncaniella sp.]MDE6580898.1 ATP synthase F1 subunit epsilon [Duncaniella sp.]